MKLWRWFKTWWRAPRCVWCNSRLDKVGLPSLRDPLHDIECMGCGTLQPKPKKTGR